MITIGSKIELVKPMGMFDKVGEVCSVTNVTKDAVITFKCSIGIGCMSYDEFEKYFKIYTEEAKLEKDTKRKWSKWKTDTYKYYTLKGFSRTVPVKYRTNGKIIELRTDFNYDKTGIHNLRVKSYCNKTDKFDLEFGLDLCDYRMQIKMMQNELEDIINNLD